MDYPAVGFASGVERVSEAVNWDVMDSDGISKLDFYVIVLGEVAFDKAYEIVRKLQFWGFSADMDYASGKLKTQFKRSEARNAQSIVIIGEEEIEKGIIKFKPGKDVELEINLDEFKNETPPSEFINR